MIEFITKILNLLPPLRHKKNPNIACVVGFFLGGMGLGLYFGSFVDCVLPLAIIIGLCLVYGDIGYWGGVSTVALYGYFRSQNSNDRLRG